MSDVHLQGLNKSFGAITALDKLDIKVADGEFLVLLGPTGAGKTTTLRLVAGLEKPDGGRVLINGKDVTGMAPANRDVAFVFQQYSLYPHYTVFDNLAFPLRAPGRAMDTAQISKRVGEVAEMLRISHKLDSRATKLSGGEMQRVSIGRALVREPNVFLMDEPLSSLDAKLREDMRVELKRIQKELGATIIYVTHDQLEAMTLADRIGILSRGRLVQTGDPREVYERPASIEAARRLGSPPVNIIAPEVAGLNGVPAETVMCGIRPEDISLTGSGRAATVEAVEHLGAETVALLDIKGERLYVLLAATDRLQRGDGVHISINRDKIMYFDHDDKRICQNRQTGEQAID